MDKEILIRDLYTSLDAIYEVNRASEELAACKKRLEDAGSDAQLMEAAIGWTTLFSIMWLIAWIIMLCFIPGFFDMNLFLVVLLGFTMLILPIVIMASCFRRRGRKRAAIYRAQVIPKVQRELGAKITEFEQIAKSEKVKTLSATVPEAYATVDAVEFFIVVLQNQRADTLKEAINLYEEHLHREELMQAQETIIELSHRNLEQGQEMIRNQQQQLQNQQKQLQTEAVILQKTKKISRQARFSNAIGVLNTAKHWNDVKKVKKK